MTRIGHEGQLLLKSHHIDYWSTLANSRICLLSTFRIRKLFSV
jgi:hypothetical protein